jgi:glycosyltransferase involved in cell wall biosynthesis
LKILHIVPSYLPATRYGGPIYSVHGLCKGIVKVGHDVSVFTTNVDGTKDSDVPLGKSVDLDGVKVWYFPSKVLRRLYWSPQLGKALKEQIKQFDIVHLHSIFLWPTWAAARCAKKAGVPYIIAPRGMLVRDLIKRKSRWLKSAWINLIERRTIAQSSGIHITAEIEQQEIEEFGFKLPPFYYVPNGIDKIDMNSLNGVRSKVVPDFPYVLFLSRINWKKGLDRLIHAWRDVPDMQLVIAGNDEEGYQVEIEKLAKKEGVDARIKFIGPVHGKDKWLLYKNAELFVLPSHSENFGIVVLESMAMACPVIVTPEVGLASVVAESNCGVVVDGEPQLLASAINDLLGDEDKRKSMGARGKQTAEKQFMWDGIADQMEQVYKRVIASFGGQGNG